VVNSTPLGIRKYGNFTSNTKGLNVLIFNLCTQLFVQGLRWVPCRRHDPNVYWNYFVYA